MATGVTASHDGRQAGAPSHGPVPGSPTLTNPDMILPDYEMPDSPPGPSMGWRDPSLDQLDFQLPPSNTYRSMPTTTPIIYGNGTMLSDIGEVTEAESTIGPSSRRASSRYSGYTETETFGPSAVALNKLHQRRSKMGRDRAASIESTSTITTTRDQRATFGDFDDSMSVDDSVFQGDDEESMASGYVEGTIPKSARIRTTKADEGNEQYSTSYISSQAEQILANAKKRLTAMEGNLFRARTSLGYSDGSTPSPQNGRPGTSSSAHRDGTNGTVSAHARIKSDDIREVKQPAQFLQRSASAMGAAGGYRKPSSRSRRSEPALPNTDRPAYGISQHPLDTTLEALCEDEDQESLYEDSLPDSALLSPTFGVYQDRGLTRSHSVAQMRDIQDQMHGLRGKISSLKEQARADSMKRRSLQSLRTPSPFTHAQWGLGLMEPRQIKDVSSGEATPTPGSPNGEDEQGKISHNGVVESEGDAPIPNASIPDEQKSSGSERQSSGSSSSKKLDTATSPNDGYFPHVDTQSSVNEDIDDDMRTENGDAVEGLSDSEGVYKDAQDDVSDYESASGESTYHDSQQEQMSHEDRDDAFDYEHFFLHSAMGSISRQSRRGDAGSEYSDDSVETTRGPMSSLSRKRRSLGSNASDETFATATEGRASRSSAFKSEYGTATEGGYDELPPLEEVRSNEDEDERNGGQYDTKQRHNSVIYRPTSTTQADRLHRPSISSFESTGTNRSFPLINRAKLNGGVLTPGGSPDPILRSVSETLLGEATNAANRHSHTGAPGAPIQGLHKDDQVEIERLVASLGKCVLGLAEASRAGSEAREFMRRIDAARRILEGLDES